MLVVIGRECHSYLQKHYCLLLMWKQSHRVFYLKIVAEIERVSWIYVCCYTGKYICMYNIFIQRLYPDSQFYSIFTMIKSFFRHDPVYKFRTNKCLPDWTLQMKFNFIAFYKNQKQNYIVNLFSILIVKYFLSTFC